MKWFLHSFLPLIIIFTLHALVHRDLNFHNSQEFILRMGEISFFLFSLFFSLLRTSKHEISSAILDEKKLVILYREKLNFFAIPSWSIVEMISHNPGYQEKRTIICNSANYFVLRGMKKTGKLSGIKLLKEKEWVRETERERGITAKHWNLSKKKRLSAPLCGGWNHCN